MGQPTLQDLNAPFDPTGYGQISGAQLLQLVTGATPTGGLVLNSPDINGLVQTPDANTNVKWQRYLWLRVITDAGGNPTGVGLYYWNSAAVNDPTYLKWQSVIYGAIPANSVGNAQLQPASVTDDKIVSMSYAKLSGAPGAFPPSGNAGGVLGGVFPNPTFNAANNGVLTPQALIAPAASGCYPLRIESDGLTVGFEAFGVIQSSITTITGQKTSAAVMTAGNPGVAEGAQLASIAFTPKSATSIIRVRLIGRMAADLTTGHGGVFALFNGANLLAFTNVYAFVDGGATTRSQLESALEAYVASWGLVAHTVQARLGGAAAGTGTFGLANGMGAFIVEELFGTLANV